MAETAEGKKKPHRFRPGTVALRNIRKHQKKSDLIIPRLPFKRLVREVLQEFIDDNVRVSEDAYLMLQHYVEASIISYYQNSLLAAIHADRTRLQPKDMGLVSRIQEDRTPAPIRRRN